MQPLIEALTIIIPLTTIMVTLFAWLRQDIKAQGERLDKRIDIQSKELNEAIKAQGNELCQDIKTQGNMLRQEIKAQGERSDKRTDEQGKDIRTLIAEVSALKATVETFFRLRVDPPQPPDNPGAAQAGKAA